MKKIRAQLSWFREKLQKAMPNGVWSNMRTIGFCMLVGSFFLGPQRLLADSWSEDPVLVIATNSRWAPAIILQAKREGYPVAYNPNTGHWEISIKGLKYFQYSRHQDICLIPNGDLIRRGINDGTLSTYISLNQPYSGPCQGNWYNGILLSGTVDDLISHLSQGTRLHCYLDNNILSKEEAGLHRCFSPPVIISNKPNPLYTERPQPFDPDPFVPLESLQGAAVKFAQETRTKEIIDNIRTTQRKKKLLESQVETNAVAANKGDWRGGKTNCSTGQSSLVETKDSARAASDVLGAGNAAQSGPPLGGWGRIWGYLRTLPSNTSSSFKSWAGKQYRFFTNPLTYKPRTIGTGFMQSGLAEDVIALSIMSALSYLGVDNQLVGVVVAGGTTYAVSSWQMGTLGMQIQWALGTARVYGPALLTYGTRLGSGALTHGARLGPALLAHGARLGPVLKPVGGGAVLAAPFMVYAGFQAEYSKIRTEHAASTDDCMDLSAILYKRHRARCEKNYPEGETLKECLGTARRIYKRELDACMEEFNSSISSLFF